MKKVSGFTLIEFMILVSIIAIMLSFLLPALVSKNMPPNGEIVYVKSIECDAVVIENGLKTINVRYYNKEKKEFVVVEDLYPIEYEWKKKLPAEKESE